MSAEFHPAVARWFARTFAAPTPAQRAAWPVIAAQRHVLIAAPTGSGKTLAAFLAAIDELVRIGVTTPESLYILLGSESGRRMLASTRTVIVDEIHAMVGAKRGVHLALSLERLESLAGRRLTRVGLSATQKPVEEVARFLVGTR